MEENQNKELKITVEAVKRAAQNCSQAKAVLQELFPEAFRDEEMMHPGTIFRMTDKATKEIRYFLLTKVGLGTTYDVFQITNMQSGLPILHKGTRQPVRLKGTSEGVRIPEEVLQRFDSDVSIPHPDGTGRIKVCDL